MITTRSRRFRRHRSSSGEGAFFKKQSNEQSFFGDGSSHELFFQPAGINTPSTIKRTCEKCEEENKKVQRLPEKKEEEKKLMRVEDKKEEDKKLQRQPEKKEKEKLQKKEQSSSNQIIQSRTTNYINSLNGKGQSLSKQQQHFFGSRMDYDFSSVKIHSDKDAAASAKEVNAKAYTIGNNVVFNEGQYNFDSGEGKKLLAHELTHVMQQNNSEATDRVNRHIDFKETTPVENINLAERFVEAYEKGEASSHFGKTDPVINDVDLTTPGISNSIKIPLEGDIQSTPQGKHTECSFSKIPTNTVSYKMWLPSNSDKWRYVTDIKRIKNAFGKRPCSNSQVTVILTGDPDSATVYTNTKKHEKKHAWHVEQLYKTVLEPFDKNLEQLKVPAKDESTCKSILVQMSKAKAQKAWSDFVSGFTTLAQQFHGSEEGHNGIVGISDTDTDCNWVKVKGKA